MSGDTQIRRAARHALADALERQGPGWRNTADSIRSGDMVTSGRTPPWTRWSGPHATRSTTEPMTDTPTAPDPVTPEQAAVELVDLTAARDRDADGLSPMQRAFCDHALDLMGHGERYWRKEAARRAGYAEPRGAAHDLVRLPQVVRYMSLRMTEATSTVNVDRSFVLFNALACFRACEAGGDFRTAHRYLDTIARHVDVGAFTRAAADGDHSATAGSVTLPFDPARLSTDELANLIALMRKGASGQPTS